MTKPSFKEMPFTVNSSGKKVVFSPSNLYWDGSAFHFEEHQYDYPTSWSTSHVGHFFWSKSKDVAIASSYSDDSTSTIDTFFASNGGAIEGYTVLSQTEWNYLFSHALAKNSSSQNTITIAGKNCIVLKPDGFSGTVSDSYTAEQWSTAESESGLVALPLAGYRRGTSFNYVGSYGFSWSGTPYLGGPNYAYYTSFDSGNANTGIDFRYEGFSVRLVKVV